MQNQFLVELDTKSNTIIKIMANLHHQAKNINVQLIQTVLSDATHWMIQDLDEKIKKQILTKSRIKMRKLTLKNYNLELTEKLDQLFQSDKQEFFRLLKKTVILNKSKREGGIFICFHDDNYNICVGQEIYKNCFDQLDCLSNSVLNQPSPIPSLNELSKQEIDNLQKMIPSDKAVSYDCITYQFVKNCNWKMLSDLWNEQTFICNKKIGWARLVPLNKVYPEIPNKKQFRPLVILSPLLKYIELRFYEQLSNSSRMEF